MEESPISDLPNGERPVPMSQWTPQRPFDSADHLEAESPTYAPPAAESSPERLSAQPAQGVWAAQFGPGQHRFWFVPRAPSTQLELFDRAGGTLLRELGRQVTVSALYLYPVERGSEDPTRTFMLHLTPRDPTMDTLAVAEYIRLTRLVVEELGDLGLEHWPPAVEYVRRVPTSELTRDRIPVFNPSAIDLGEQPSEQLVPVWEFATTFDGYEHFDVRAPPGRLGGSARHAADVFARSGCVPVIDDPDVLRSYLFYEERRWNLSRREDHGMMVADVRYVAALLSALRRVVAR